MPLPLVLVWRKDNTSPLLANFIGEVQSLPQVKANQSLVVQEGQGIAKAEPIVFARPAATPTPTPTPQSQ